MDDPLLQYLHGCPSLRALKFIHARLLIDAFISSSDIIHSKIIRAYSRHGALADARKVFVQITQPNAFLWTSLIHGCVQNRRYSEAFQLFRRMLAESVLPLTFTISSVLKGLAKEPRLREGETVHGFILKAGLVFDTLVQNSLLDFFMKCGKVDAATCVFAGMHQKDVPSWNSMISGHVNNGRLEVARELFDSMPHRDAISWTILICGYVKADAMDEARLLFLTMPSKDSTAWKVMVSGYIKAGDIHNAYLLFKSSPTHDATTWNLIISGLCKAGDLQSARDIFSKMPCKDVVSWTMMLDGCFKAGDINGALCLFDQMPERNVVSWCTMISGLANNGRPRDALKVFERFKEHGIMPNEALIFEVISACSHLGVLETAEAVIHDYLGTSHFSNIRVTTSLIDMYAKCGSIERAMQVFEKACPKDLHCYSSMIGAFATHGLGREAIHLFGKMQRDGVKPDAVTFLGVLSACSHGGFVNEGRKYFKQITDEFGMAPSEKHFACIIDILCRSGHLKEAHTVITEMPMTPPSVVWGALLAGCRAHRNVPLAEVAAAKLLRMEPGNSGNYILLASVYAAAGMWGRVARVRGLIRERRVRKNKGSSWIELDRIVHEFSTADESHLDNGSLRLILDLLCEDMRLLAMPIFVPSSS